MFIALLGFSRSLATKYVSLGKEPCIIGPTLIDLNPAEFNYYPFMVNVDEFSGSLMLLMIYLQKHVFWVKQKT